jgi:hypothetical protein
MNRRDAALRPAIFPGLAPGLAAAFLSACQVGLDSSITKSQNVELNEDVAAYHICVAHTAARIDDGQSPIAEVAGAAMDRCLPEAVEISKLLDGTKLSETFKSRYLDELFAAASRQSAVMLRRRRNPDWDDGAI